MQYVKAVALQKSTEKENCNCHHERHLGGIALKVYNLFWRLEKKTGGIVCLSNAKIARMVGAHCKGKKQRFDHITRVKTALARGGWLDFRGVSKGAKTGTWSGARYKVIPHSDWAESMARKLGRSSCHPNPLQLSVSFVHPGGRAFQNKKRAQEARTDTTSIQSHRAGLEARTVLRPGSTRTVRSGKHAQSVDFESTGIRRDEQLTQGVLPPATPQRASPIPVNQNSKPQVEQWTLVAWRALEPWGVKSSDGTNEIRAIWASNFRRVRTGCLLDLYQAIDAMISNVPSLPESLREAHHRVEKALQSEHEARKTLLNAQKAVILGRSQNVAHVQVSVAS